MIPNATSLSAVKLQLLKDQKLLPETNAGASCNVKARDPVAGAAKTQALKDNELKPERNKEDEDMLKTK